MPFLFSQGWKAKQLHQVLAHNQIGEQGANFAHPGQSRHRPFRTIHDITNAAHIDQNMVCGAVIDTSCEFPNHTNAFCNASANPLAPP